MISKSSISFLKELKLNNNREWFLSKNKTYQQAKLEFTELIKQVISNLGKKSKMYADIDASKCLFRINRDVRFSSDKSPYKTNFGASINAHGKKSEKAGLYFHFEPGNSFTGGGIYMPSADVLAKVRQEIDYNYDEFLKIVSHKSFLKHYNGLDMTEALKNPPRGYDKQNNAIEYLKLKSFVAITKLADRELLDEHLADKISEKLIALLPLIDFLNKGLDD
jgi:uncharacterized protein (TIGR02453 family)